MPMRPDLATALKELLQDRIDSLDNLIGDGPDPKSSPDAAAFMARLQAKRSRADKGLVALLIDNPNA